MNRQGIPVDTRALFKPLDHLLIECLRQLDASDWNRQTIAKHWKVKDVASHLLDGNLRTLSMQRDRYFGEQPPKIDGYVDLVNWLNQLNADWVKATKRLSPDVLVLLLELTGDRVSDYYGSLDPWQEAVFSVDWAGESTSYNWMHVAREYTEKWHHQQQIRDTLGDLTILNQQYFRPVMDTFILALPHIFREVNAEEGTAVKVSITTEAGGTWWICKTDGKWKLVEKADNEVAAVTIPLDLSWKLFTKSLRPNQIKDQVTTQGDKRLAEKVLGMVSVMA